MRRVASPRTCPRGGRGGGRPGGGGVQGSETGGERDSAELGKLKQQTLALDPWELVRLRKAFVLRCRLGPYFEIALREAAGGWSGGFNEEFSFLRGGAGEEVYCAFLAAGEPLCRALCGSGARESGAEGESDERMFRRLKKAKSGTELLKLALRSLLGVGKAPEEEAAEKGAEEGAEKGAAAEEAVEVPLLDATSTAQQGASQQHTTWQLVTPEDGQHPYYWDAATGEVAWELPAAAAARAQAQTAPAPQAAAGVAWMELSDEKGNSYWWHKETNQVSWTLPSLPSTVALPPSNPDAVSASSSDIVAIERAAHSDLPLETRVASAPTDTSVSACHSNETHSNLAHRAPLDTAPRQAAEESVDESAAEYVHAPARADTAAGVAAASKRPRLLEPTGPIESVVAPPRHPCSGAIPGMPPSQPPPGYPGSNQPPLDPPPATGMRPGMVGLPMGPRPIAEGMGRIGGVPLGAGHLAHGGMGVHPIGGIPPAELSLIERTVGFIAASGGDQALQMLMQRQVVSKQEIF